MQVRDRHVGRRASLRVPPRPNACYIAAGRRRGRRPRTGGVWALAGKLGLHPARKGTAHHRATWKSLPALLGFGVMTRRAARLRAARERSARFSSSQRGVPGMSRRHGTAYIRREPPSLPATDAAPAPPYHLARRDARNATVPRSFCTRLQRHSMHWRCSCAWTAGVSGLALACYLQPRLALKGRPCASRSAAACSFARHGRPSSSVPSARGCAEGRTALPGRQGGARCQTRFGLGCTQNECFGLSATWGRRRGALLHVSGAMCGRARFSQRAPNARTLRPAPPLPRVSSPRADAARAEDERAQSIRDAISSVPALAGCARTGVAGGLAARNMLACLALAERMKDSRGASRPQNVAWVRGGTWWHGSRQR